MAFKTRFKSRRKRAHYGYRKKNRVSTKKAVSTRQNHKGIQTLHWRGMPFPKELRTEFTYGSNTLVASVAGAVVAQRVAMNDLYDPDITSGGHQPRYYDSLLGVSNGTAPYYQSVVYASKISCIVMATGTDTVSQRAYVAILPRVPNSSVPSSLQEMLERREGKGKYLGYWGGGTDKVQLSMYSRINQWAGVKDVADNLALLSAAYNAHPSVIPEWDICIVPIDETTSYTYRILWKITYYTKLFNMNDVADS